jgi:TonB family protein
MQFSLPPPRARLISAGSLAASLIAHGALVFTGALLVGAWSSGERAGQGDPSTQVIEIEAEPLRLPGAQSSSLSDSRAEVSSEPNLPDPGGGEHLARPDMAHAGKGGSRRADAPALNLADRDDGLQLNRELVTRVDRDQIQRLATAHERTSSDDRRATTHPMELVFLASGTGTLEQRRTAASSNPSRGAEVAPPASLLGGAAGTLPLPRDGDLPTAIEGGISGGERSSPGLGIRRGRPGSDHRASAAVAFGRPLVAQAQPSIPSDRDGTPRDTLDSEQEVSTTLQSLVHASTAGGLLGGGTGGEQAGGPAGSLGERGPGSRAQPFGSGTGPYRAIDELDPRILAYWRAVRAKIWPMWEHAFPKWAALDGRQGLATVSVLIWADGHVEDVRVARSSGIPEFDANVREAVLRAAPFPPFPPTIHAASLRKTISFDMTNPTVR